MDPTETLRQLRIAVSRVEDETDDRFCELAHLVEVLDAWLSSGGFLPDEWATVNRSAVKRR